MKHAKKTYKAKNKRKKRLKQVKVLAVLFVIALAAAAVTVYRDYQARPGFLERIWISDRSDDYITVAWERPRNVHKFIVTYNGETIEVNGRKKNIKITGLTADTVYRISVRADSKEREGFEALTKTARTKKSQAIEGDAPSMSFANRPVDLKQSAATEITYAPGKGYTVTEDNRIVFTKSGKITVTAQAAETEQYAGAVRDITIEVLDSVNVDADGAAPHTFYRLNRDNCECVKTITGTKEAMFPQSFVLSNGQYLVSYISKEEVQRIICFGDKKTVYVPEADLGHANGLTMAHGMCYSVRGGTGLQCVTFDPPNSNYGSFELAYDASGIAYDEVTGVLYTSSRRQLAAYDSDMNLLSHTGRVSRSITYYVQDCAAYNGILLQGVTGKDYLGTNYIDFYDMTESKYLGSIECELGEIESLLIDEEGYIEILCNVKGTQDCIWKTPLNMKTIGAE